MPSLVLSFPSLAHRSRLHKVYTYNCCLHPSEALRFGFNHMLCRELQVSCGAQHTACVLQDGTAYTWGCALHGRLGLEGLNLPRGGAVLGDVGSDLTQLIVPTPQHVRAIGREHVSQVSCGSFHTAFLVASETGAVLYTCGLGLSGRLGES